ncbi:nlpC/P60 family protein [Mycolicibacterium hassiacum DSM 44199]|jgi:cell wall-associated NlpC family hydrolase|uniref:NlpC/P60 family protein n=1 Tax=Mycolicibacterium hassiacum (strain DSM 44199 / CIP 105218 / JCM 12690 / 3849) TaxID=1122247 RepID=K5BG02_MYCHD|nr:NlpC/P60 family peptidoglycan-binding protein RipD [Mycolicibacterium hassiacum]EKF23606.1 nlpC/P60 family protein [Mycolicibacterium hassiacum DSM 44199]MDA4088673.1 hydrolase [Mycolicibacterium hassiacum DSM 44199]PZN24459.1 MAG: NlpC/P60 family protein [Mycolicibacterium hassiacum]VCT90213.1 Peptidoglycan endopeptidase RipB [Mycolicibacterium hassiacum DSM 44199]
MRNIIALAIGLALLLATPGLAGAQPYPYPRPLRSQKAVEVVIARAVSQVGVPFSYGGGDVNGPTRGSGPAANAIGLDPQGRVVGLDPALDTVGFDASGLMVYAFAGAGIKLPRSSGEQYKVGRKIPPNLALPGDLIFYGPNGTQSVALFIGNGRMVEVGENGVTISPVRFNNMAPYLIRIIE